MAFESIEARIYCDGCGERLTVPMEAVFGRATVSPRLLRHKGWYDQPNQNAHWCPGCKGDAIARERADERANADADDQEGDS